VDQVGVGAAMFAVNVGGCGGPAAIFGLLYVSRYCLPAARNPTLLERTHFWVIFLVNLRLILRLIFNFLVISAKNRPRWGRFPLSGSSKTLPEIASARGRILAS
jgi:hypothetical protein